MKEVFYLGTLILQLLLTKLKPLLHEVCILLKKREGLRGGGYIKCYSTTLYHRHTNL